MVHDAPSLGAVDGFKRTAAGSSSRAVTGLLLSQASHCRGAVHPVPTSEALSSWGRMSAYSNIHVFGR